MRTRLTTVASITERLDSVASELEQEDPRVALAIDQISDRLDGREAFLGIGGPKKEFPIERLKQKGFNFASNNLYKKYVGTAAEFSNAVRIVEDTIGDFRSNDVEMAVNFKEIKGREELGKLTEKVKDAGKIRYWSDGFKKNETKNGREYVSYTIKSPKDGVDIFSKMSRETTFESGKITWEYRNVMVSGKKQDITIVVIGSNRG